MPRPVIAWIVLAPTVMLLLHVFGVGPAVNWGWLEITGVVWLPFTVLFIMVNLGVINTEEC